MTTTESALRVAGVAAEAVSVETKEEDEVSATGAQTSAEKMDVDEKVNSIFGGGAQAELRVVFTPEERGGNMGDVVTAEFIRFSSDDKIDSSGSGGVGEENPPPVSDKNAITAPADDSIPGGDSGGGSLGKVIHLKLLPSTPHPPLRLFSITIIKGTRNERRLGALNHLQMTMTMTREKRISCRWISWGETKEEDSQRQYLV